MRSLLGLARRRHNGSAAASSAAATAEPAAPSGAAEAGTELPDPARPPGNRGEWGRSALANVGITEVVKRQIHSSTLPWEK